MYIFKLLYKLIKPIHKLISLKLKKTSLDYYNFTKFFLIKKFKQLFLNRLYIIISIFIKMIINNLIKKNFSYLI